MIEVKRGEAQPLACRSCRLKYGYVVTDNIRTQYDTEYNENGALIGGSYSDYQPVVRENRKAHCANCGDLLPFRIKIEKQ